MLVAEQRLRYARKGLATMGDVLAGAANKEPVASGVPPDLGQGVAAAVSFLQGLARERLLPGPIEDVVLEEVATNERGDWLITLGYRRPGPFDALALEASLAGGRLPLLALRPPRSEHFKTFTVRRATGEVVAMSMRDRH